MVPLTLFMQVSPQKNQTPPNPGSQASDNDLALAFNTALVSTRAATTRDFSGEIHQVMATPAFQAILSSIRQHAAAQGLSDREAAEQVIRTFRRVDEIWSAYVFQEGVERLGSGT